MYDIWPEVCMHSEKNTVHTRIGKHKIGISSVHESQEDILKRLKDFVRKKCFYLFMCDIGFYQCEGCNACNGSKKELDIL